MDSVVMKKSKIEEEVKEILLKTHDRLKEFEVNLNSDIRNQLGLDSIELVAWLAEIEDHYEIYVESELIPLNDFKLVKDVTDFYYEEICNEQ